MLKACMDSAILKLAETPPPSVKGTAAAAHVQPTTWVPGGEQEPAEPVRRFKTLGGPLSALGDGTR